MKPRLLSQVSLSAVVALCLVAAAPDDAAPSKGRLLIMGGAVGRHSDEIYPRLVKDVPPGGTIGVVPTASEVDDPAGSSIKKIQGYAGPDKKVIEIPVRMKTADKANDPAVAALIDKCDAVFFVGGAQSRVVNAFRPGGKDSISATALRRVLERGGVLSGSSAGAAIMADPMIYHGTSSMALSPGATTKPGEDEGEGGTGAVPMGPGMGFFPFGTVDQHFLERGRLGRLIVAMEEQHQMLGWGIPEDRAIDVDLASAKMQVIGDTGLVQVDRHAANGRENIRLSLLSNGDTVNAKTGEIATTRPAMKLPDPKPADVEKGLWEKRKINALVKALSEGAPTASASDDKWELQLSRDDQTKFYGTPDSMTVTGMKLDLRKIQ